MIRSLLITLVLLAGCATTTPPAEPAPTFSDEYFSEMFNDDFFRNSSNPFQEMHRIVKSLDPNKKDRTARNAFLSWYWVRFGQYPAEQIHFYEDDGALYITLDINVDDRPEVNLKATDGELNISGQMVREGRYSKSVLRLEQTLPVPGNIDPASVVSWKNGELFIIRFDKTDAVS